MKFKPHSHELIKPSRRDLVIGAGAFALAPSFPAGRAEARTRLLAGNHHSIIPTTNYAEPMKLGAGGFSSTGDADYASGKMVSTCDTINAYRYNRTTSKWDRVGKPSQLGRFTFQNIPQFLQIKIARTNTSRLCAIVKNDPGDDTSFAFARSDDDGEHWTFNDNMEFHFISYSITWRGVDQSLAIDPNNADVIYFGCWHSSTNQGLWICDDGGLGLTSFVKNTSVPNPTAAPGVCAITFDISGGTIMVGGKVRTKNVICSSAGNGLYLSTDGGQTFAHITGSPNTSVSGQTIDNGTYAGWSWFCSVPISNVATQVWKHKVGTGLTHVTIPVGYVGAGGELPSGTLSLCQDPAASGDIIFSKHNGFEGSRTFNNGTTFLNDLIYGINPPNIITVGYVPGFTGAWGTTTGGPIPYLSYTYYANASGSAVDTATIIRDPLNNNRVIYLTGVGPWYADWLTTSSQWYAGSMILTGMGPGIEQLVGHDIITIPGSPYPPVCGVHDRGTISSGTGNTYATDYYPRSFMHTWCSDYAKDNNAVVLCMSQFIFTQAYNLGISTNYGQSGSFALFSGAQPPPTCLGASIAFGKSSPFSAIMIDWNNCGATRPKYYNGSAWVNCAGFTATSAWPTGGFGFSNAAKLLCANESRPGEYLVYQPDLGFLLSTDGAGATFAALSGTAPKANNGDLYAAKLISIPGHGDEHIWAPCGSQRTGGLWFNDNNGAQADWVQDTQLLYVAFCGIGKQVGSRHRLWVVGRKSGDTFEDHVYICDNWNVIFLGGTPTWTTVATNLAVFSDSECVARAFSGDFNDEKLAYYGTNGEGYFLLHSAT